MTSIEITSFGYLHGEPPQAHLTLDLREHFRDPHVSPELRHMTALDIEVRDAVRATPGIVSLRESLSVAVRAFLLGPSGDNPIRVAVGCAGGRHRAPAFAAMLGQSLKGSADTVTWSNRDLHRPVVER